MVKKLSLRDFAQSFSCSCNFSSEVDIDTNGYDWRDWPKLWSKDYIDSRVVFDDICAIVRVRGNTSGPRWKSKIQLRCTVFQMPYSEQKFSGYQHFDLCHSVLKCVDECHQLWITTSSVRTSRNKMAGGDFGTLEIFNSVNPWKIKSITWIKRKREPYHIVDTQGGTIKYKRRLNQYLKW